MGNFFNSFGSDDTSPLDGLDGVQVATPVVLPNLNQPPPGLVMHPVIQQPQGTPDLAALMRQAGAPLVQAAPPPPVMSPARRAFYKASLYMQIAEASAFDNADAIASEVDAECRAFYERRVAEVMAGRTDNGEEAILTDRHMRVLAQFANTLLRRPEIMQAFGVVQDEEPEEEPAAPAPPKPRAAPKARARQLSTTPKQEAPAPAPAAPPAPPPVQQQPAAPPRQAPPQRAAAPGVIPVSQLPPHQGVFEYGGRKFRARHVPMKPEDQGEGYRAQIEAMQPGSAVELPNGVIVGRRDSGGYFKFVKLDVTRQTKAAGIAAMPMPQGQAMEWATANHAVQTVSSMDKNVQGIASHVLTQG